MNPAPRLSLDGRLLERDEEALAYRRLYEAPGLCQHLHLGGRRVLQLTDHLRVLDHAARTLYGVPCTGDAVHVASWCERLFDRWRYPADRAMHAILHVLPAPAPGQWAWLLRAGEVLVDPTYALRTLRPRVDVVRSDLPFFGLPTTMLFDLARMAGALVQRAGAHDALLVDRSGCLLVAGGAAAPLFAVAGDTIRTAALDMVSDSVERRRGIAAIARAGLRLEERAPLEEELDDYDELFWIDYRGLSSVERVGTQPYMDIRARRIASRLTP